MNKILNYIFNDFCLIIFAFLIETSGCQENYGHYNKLPFHLRKKIKDIFQNDFPRTLLDLLHIHEFYSTPTLVKGPLYETFFNSYSNNKTPSS